MASKLTCLLFFLMISFNSGTLYAQYMPESYDKWLGNWKTKVNGDVIHESWKKNKDGNYTGESWTIKANGDSVHTEVVRLYMLNDNIYYSPLVTGQHDGKEVNFRLIIGSSSEWMFSNPDNDFPKYILYKWIDEKHLRASLGNSDNENDTNLIFEYERY